MTAPLAGTVSRIDKFWLDRDGVSPEQARQFRSAHVPVIDVGDDVGSSAALQIALLTAVNLACKCFGAPVPVRAAESVWNASCRVAVSARPTLGEALAELGAVKDATEPPGADRARLAIGSATLRCRSLRVTFDGWCVAVGPAHDVTRLPERSTCPLAPLAAAAVAVGEVFAEFAGISVTATRRPISFSLWRPDLPIADPEALGQQVHEFPLCLELFGLGHLGQAYLWAAACLPYAEQSELRFYLCDDDVVEAPNVETGALLQVDDIDGRKTRQICAWLKARGFEARLLERFIDSSYRRCDAEPRVALSGFDNNEARQYLATAGFTAIFDSGLGGEAGNFDSIAVHAWPHARAATQVWPIESGEQRQARAERERRRAGADRYQGLAADECGRVLVAGKAVAVPFVGTTAACFVLAEILRACNGGPVFYDVRLRTCSLGHVALGTRIAAKVAPPMAGVKMAKLLAPA
jgi:hypothetical protein